MQLAAYATYFLATALPRAASFLLIIVMTRLLPVSEYGAFALAIVLGDIMDNACSNWVRILLLREQGKDARFGGEIAGRLVVLACGVTLVAVALSLIGAHFLDVREPVIFGLVTASYVIANALSRFSLTVLQLHGNSRTYGLIEGSRALGVLLLVPSFAIISGNYYLPAFMLNGVTFVAGVIGVVAGLRESTAISVPGDGYIRSASLGLPIIVVTLLTYGINGVDRFFLQAYTTTATVGLYSAAYTLGRQPVEVIASSINLVGFPALVVAHANGDMVTSRKILTDNTMLLLVICPFFAVLFLALRQPIADIVLPAAYHKTAFVVTPLAVIGATFMCLKFFVFDNVFHLVRRNWLQTLCLMPGAAVTIALGFLLVPSLDGTGVVIGYLVGAIVALVVTIIVTSRFVIINLPWRDVVAIFVAQVIAGGSAWLVAELLSLAGPLLSNALVAGVAGGIAGLAVYAGLLALLRVSIIVLAVQAVRRKLKKA